MYLPFDIESVRLFLRFLLGFLFVGSSLSKLLHPTLFRLGLQNYQLLPRSLVREGPFLKVLSFALPLAELLAGLDLISGLLLLPGIVLACILLFLFSGALTINLLRGRNDLSCHCGGALGNQHISWWHIGRNGVFIILLIFLLFTPPDHLNLNILFIGTYNISTIMMNTILPVAFLAGGTLLVLYLSISIKNVWSL